MCVEVVKSIALNPTRSITGAIVRVLAVSIPSAAQRHWFPSRSEVSTSCTSAIAGILRLGGRAVKQTRHKSCIDTARVKFRVREHALRERQIRVAAFEPDRCNGMA